MERQEKTRRMPDGVPLGLRRGRRNQWRSHRRRRGGLSFRFFAVSLGFGCVEGGGVAGSLEERENGIECTDSNCFSPEERED